MQRICQVLGWLLLSVLLVTGGVMTFFILTENPFWTENPLRQRYIPIGHAHAGLLAMALLHMGLYLDRTAFRIKTRNLIAVLAILGTLTLPGGFLFSALPEGATKPTTALVMVPIGGLLVAASWMMVGIGIWKAAKQTKEGRGEEQ